MRYRVTNLFHWMELRLLLTGVTFYFEDDDEEEEEEGMDEVERRYVPEVKIPLLSVASMVQKH